jgi:hypothetical protein
VEVAHLTVPSILPWIAHSSLQPARLIVAVKISIGKILLFIKIFTIDPEGETPFVDESVEDWAVSR